MRAGPLDEGVTKFGTGLTEGDEGAITEPIALCDTLGVGTFTQAVRTRRDAGVTAGHGCVSQGCLQVTQMSGALDAWLHSKTSASAPERRR